jgi:hypothetical protein
VTTSRYRQARPFRASRTDEEKNSFKDRDRWGRVGSPSPRPFLITCCPLRPWASPGEWTTPLRDAAPPLDAVMHGKLGLLRQRPHLSQGERTKVSHETTRPEAPVFEAVALQLLVIWRLGRRDPNTARQYNSRLHPVAAQA